MNSSVMAYFKFLNLARELRDEIYHYALVSPEDILIFNTTPNPAYCCCDTHFTHNGPPVFYGAHQSEKFKNHLPDGLRRCKTADLPERRACSLHLPISTSETSPNLWHPNVALLRTCKQVNKEALPILYSENRFCFDSRKLMVMGIEDYDVNLIRGPAFMSATAICFDFLMSLSKPALASIRKLKFHTNPFRWQHSRVFKFIAKETNTDDVELHFDTENPREQPSEIDVSTLPWSTRYSNTLDFCVQIDVMAIYDVCKLNELRRLKITFVSRGKYYGPILHDSRANQNRLHAQLISLFRSKMLLERTLQSSKVPEWEQRIVSTSMMSRQGSSSGSGRNQTIDHLHNNVAESSGISTSPNSNPFEYAIMPFNSLSPDCSITEQLVYSSPCPVCGEMGTMRSEVRDDEERELLEHQPFTFTSNESVANFSVKSWPDQLNKKAFYELVTGNEAKISEL